MSHIKKRNLLSFVFFGGQLTSKAREKKSSLTCDSAFLLALGRGDGIYRKWLLNNAQNYYFAKKILLCIILFIGCFGS